QPINQRTLAASLHWRCNCETRTDKRGFHAIGVQHPERNGDRCIVAEAYVFAQVVVQIPENIGRSCEGAAANINNFGHGAAHNPSFAKSASRSARSSSVSVLIGEPGWKLGSPATYLSRLSTTTLEIFGPSRLISIWPLRARA